jgi:hypothetical protein
MRDARADIDAVSRIGRGDRQAQQTFTPLSGAHLSQR